MMKSFDTLFSDRTNYSPLPPVIATYVSGLRAEIWLLLANTHVPERP